MTTETVAARRAYANEIEVGSSYEFSTYAITENDVVRFAEAWDPQWFHIDGVAAGHGPYGGLIASGMHTLAIYQRLSVINVFERWHVIAGRCLRDVRFLRPLRPGATVTGRLHIDAIDNDKPGRALVVTRGELVGDDGKQLLTMATELYVRARSQSHK
jgi:acyl dehydratase